MKIPKKYEISAVITARNEQITVGKVINESIKILPNLAKKYEILINDDASSDRTPMILDSYAKKYPFIKVYHQRKALGISGGFEFLYKKAKFEMIFTNAADGQYTIKDLPKMIKKISEGYDIVIGKRVSKEKYNVFRRIISFSYNQIPKLLFGVNLYDAGSNKLYKTQVLRKIKPISKSVFSEAERIIRANKLGYKVSSVPIKHFKRKEGTASSIRTRLILSCIIDMFRLYSQLYG